jgi:hypothetical protein
MDSPRGFQSPQPRPPSERGPLRPKPSAAQGRDSGLQPFAKRVIHDLFTRRHESPYMRYIARATMRDARRAREWRRHAAV